MENRINYQGHQVQHGAFTHIDYRGNILYGNYHFGKFDGRIVNICPGGHKVSIKEMKMNVQQSPTQKMLREEYEELVLGDEMSR
jgi:hypothetical protein